MPASVHAHVFRHLAMMIVAMADDRSGLGETRGFSLPKGILDWSHDVLCVDRRHSFLHIRKRIVYVFQDLGVGYPETRTAATNCPGPPAAVEDSFISAFHAVRFDEKKACQPGRPQGTNKNGTNENGADPPVYKTFGHNCASPATKPPAQPAHLLCTSSSARFTQ
jgi:hypothetical protein